MKPGPAGKETVSLIALGKTLREEKSCLGSESHLHYCERTNKRRITLPFHHQSRIRREHTPAPSRQQHNTRRESSQRDKQKLSESKMIETCFVARRSHADYSTVVYVS